MNCPICQGEMWDNRPQKAEGKFSAKAPDFKCKDKTCNGVVWPPRGGVIPEQIPSVPIQSTVIEQKTKEIKELLSAETRDVRSQRIERQHSQHMALLDFQIREIVFDDQMLLERIDWYEKDLDGIHISRAGSFAHDGHSSQ